MLRARRLGHVARVAKRDGRAAAAYTMRKPSVAAFAAALERRHRAVFPLVGLEHLGIERKFDVNSLRCRRALAALLALALRRDGFVRRGTFDAASDLPRLPRLLGERVLRLVLVAGAARLHGGY